MALLGGLGALVWSMRDRIRIAIKRAETPDPDYHIIDPETSDDPPSTTEETLDQVNDAGADEDSDSQTEGDSDKAG